MKNVIWPLAVVLMMVLGSGAVAQELRDGPETPPGNLYIKIPAGFEFPVDFHVGITKPVEIEIRVVYPSAKPGAIPKPFGGTEIYLDPTDKLTNEIIADLVPVSRQGTNESQILVELTKAGAAKLAEMTKWNIGKNLAILIDGKVTDTPTIKGVISSTQAVITGDFSYEEAGRIADRIMPNRQGKAFQLPPQYKLTFQVASSSYEKGGVVVTPVPFGDTTIYLDTTAKLTSEIVSTVKLTADEGTNKPTILIEFTKGGAAKMIELTKRHLGKKLAILVDGKVVSAPTIQAPISSVAVITGNFSREEAQRIVDGILAKNANVPRYKIFKLGQANAAAIIPVLKLLIQDDISIEADETKNSLLIYASIAPMEQVAELIAKLDALELSTERHPNADGIEEENNSKWEKFHDTLPIEFRRVVDSEADVDETWNGYVKIRYGKKVMILDKRSKLTNDVIADANVVVDDANNPSIEIEFTTVGAVRMAAMTSGHTGKQLAIIVDNTVISVHAIREVVSSKAVFSGDFSNEEAQRIAAVIVPRDVEGDSNESVNATEEKAQPITERIVETDKDTRRLYAVKLERADADSLAPILNLLFSDEITIYAHSRNSLGVRVPESLSNAVGDLIQQFDHSKADIEKIIDTESLSLFVRSKQRIDAQRNSVPTAADVQRLKKEYESVDGDVRYIVAVLRNPESHSELKLATNRALLRNPNAVQKLFELRQQINRAELAALELQLIKARKTLDDRKKNKQQIIDQRIEELKNPKLKSESPTRLEKIR